MGVDRLHPWMEIVYTLALRRLEAGSWRLEAEAGSWKLEAGSWKLEAGSWSRIDWRPT
jgi:hypothetical protein